MPIWRTAAWVPNTAADVTRTTTITTTRQYNGHSSSRRRRTPPRNRATTTITGGITRRPRAVDITHRRRPWAADTRRRRRRRRTVVTGNGGGGNSSGNGGVVDRWAGVAFISFFRSVLFGNRRRLSDKNQSYSNMSCGSTPCKNWQVERQHVYAYVDRVPSCREANE